MPAIGSAVLVDLSGPISQLDLRSGEMESVVLSVDSLTMERKENEWQSVCLHT